MRISINPGNRAVKIIKRRNQRLHDLAHINRAERIRNEAKAWRDTAEEYLAHMHGGIQNVSSEEFAEVETHYNNMLSEAIAEENCKHMKTH